MNTFGHNFRVTTFGESHGPAVGCVVDGMPAGIELDTDAIRRALDRRRTGRAGTSQRAEADEYEILSGIYQGRTLGTPIAVVVRNTDARSADYAEVATAYRPNHADYTWQARYGFTDSRGGGRASARETVGRVIAGAMAAQVLAAKGISVEAHVAELGGVPVADPAKADEIIAAARAEGDTVGGIANLVIKGVPAGIGTPVASKLSAALAAAMMSIPAVKGVEIGDGFTAAASRGSEQIDEFYADKDGRIRTRANHSGGIQGGISNGEDITMRIAFKPIATLPGHTVATVDRNGQPATICMRGRHDSSALPRALPVVEAMAAITLLDAYATLPVSISDLRNWNI